jgi:acyl-lipid omega-6 desaturase (Delta-12 desaturase)
LLLKASIVLSAVLIHPDVDVDTLEASRTKLEDRQLLIASRQFASEHRGTSWWHFATTLVALLAFGFVAGTAEYTWVRLLGSLLTGLTLVRTFILYHDYQHQSILKGSRLAGFVLAIYGYLMLTPPSVWKRTHDHHHRHNSKLFGASIGSFPIMTTTNYQVASRLERLEYRLARSPLVIAFGYFAVFMFGMCVRPLMIDPRKHWDAPLSLVVHFGFIFAIAWYANWGTAILVFLLPTWIAMSAGAYLFYVQHNFPSAKIRRCGDWTYTDAALESSSYLEMGRLMNWLTGNIGYHHVHHLNAKIPFYRLPEAMRHLPALQSPAKTSLRVRDIADCLKLKLWDTTQDCFVSFAAASTPQTATQSGATR